MLVEKNTYKIPLAFKKNHIRMPNNLDQMEHSRISGISWQQVLK
jgi:hypothetical protein